LRGYELPFRVIVVDSRARAQPFIPISIGIALFWMLPVGLVAVVASHEKSSTLGQAWFYGWFVLYGLSLMAWRLPDRWFRPKRWELEWGLYDALGIRWYKQFMLGGDIANRRIRQEDKTYRVFANATTMRDVVKQGKLSERVHVIMFLFALWPALFGAATGWWIYAGVVTAGNVVVNLYPILLQRHTRSRIVRIDERRRKATMMPSTPGGVAS
jgi:hypothetical protein